MTEFNSLLLQQTLDRLLQQQGIGLNQPITLVLGLSGGMDSVVLLHALSSICAANPVYKLKAIHVNHQLQSSADDWQQFCGDLCQKWQVPYESVTVDVDIKKGEGVEAAARKARYNAFKNKLNTNDILLTAHHLDDQIETVFLKLLRGTGVDGAAGIRPVTTFNGHYLLRPLLNVRRAALEAYAMQNHLPWINDPSNEETVYDRNYLRHEVLPLIEKRWPAYRQTVGRFSRHMQQVSDLVQEIAQQDFETVYDAEKQCLNIDKLTTLSLPRRHNTIRFWIKQHSDTIPSVEQLDQINTAIIAREDAAPVVKWANVELRRFKNGLYLLNEPLQKMAIDFSVTLQNWKPGEKLTIPGYGFLSLVETKNDGLKPSCLANAELTIKFRQGGERCTPVSRQKSQTLKKLFQEYNIPPWKRNSIPLVYINQEIAAAVGVFYCKPFAAEDEVGLKIVCEVG